ATPSARSLVSTGKSKSTQWTHVPTGASGSSMMSAKLCVFSGSAPQLSFGETSGPSQVNFLGIISPAEKKALEICSDIFSPFPWSNGPVKSKGKRQSDKRIKAANSERMNEAFPVWGRQHYGSAESKFVWRISLLFCPADLSSIIHAE